uniref:MalT-like TPR region domain-containing protein n=1 Tax=Trichuris muris TaxID=70415 RepID=A0A5S6QW07_TRIMR
MRRIFSTLVLQSLASQNCYRHALFMADGGSRRKYSAPHGVYLLGVVAAVKSLFHSPKEDAERKRIVDTVREAILSYRDGDAPRSINLLHQALSAAQQSNDVKAVNYICDVLANIYYELMDTVKAKALFLSLTDSLISSGTKKTDPAVVEISLKLADIYAMEGNYELAEEGFKFCIETQKSVVDETDKVYDKKWMKRFKTTRSDEDAERDELTDPYALYGMILESYSRYLMSRKRVEESKKHFSRALELARDIYSPLSAHIIIMMNNYAIECVKQGEYELARHYYGEVIYRAVHCHELEWQLPAFYCNYAESLWHCGQRKEALEMAERALSLAASGDKNVLKHVKEFCDSLKRDFAKSPTSVRAK